MAIDLLHRLSTTETVYYDAHLIQQEKDILCILFSPALQNSTNSQGEIALQDVVYLVTFDLQKRQQEHTLIYNCYGPAYNPTRHALVRYDASQKCWILAQQQGDWYIGLRTATEETVGNLILSPLCLLDKDESDQGFALLLDLEIHEDRYRFLSHKAVAGHMKAPAISYIDIVLHHPGWNTLEERSVVTRSGESAQDVEITHWHQWLEALQHKPSHAKDQRLTDNILLPEQTFFDPGTTNASQTAELELINRMEVAEAENAMTIADQHTRLLVLCAPETWIVPNKQPRAATEIERTGEQWHILLTGWDRAELTYQWFYAPYIGLPADPNLPAHKYPKWPDAEVATIVGPSMTNKQPTFVVTMAMQGTEELLSHGVCLTHAGQVVQVCNEALGRAPSLGLCQRTVIGVDRLATGWRLWNWQVLDEAHLRTRQPLDARCQRAAVCPQSQTGLFWLIEELPDGVRVSLRDAQTLSEVQPMGFIAEAQLLESPEDRPLESHRIAGLLPYDQTLLLLLRGTQEELLLYQVR